MIRLVSLIAVLFTTTFYCTTIQAVPNRTSEGKLVKKFNPLEFAKNALGKTKFSGSQDLFGQVESLRKKAKSKNVLNKYKKNQDYSALLSSGRRLNAKALLFHQPTRKVTGDNKTLSGKMRLPTDSEPRDEGLLPKQSILPGEPGEPEQEDTVPKPEKDEEFSSSKEDPISDDGDAVTLADLAPPKGDNGVVLR